MDSVLLLARFDCLADALHAAQSLRSAGFRSGRLHGEDRHAGGIEPLGRPVLSAIAAALACGFTGLIIGFGAGGFTPLGWAGGLSIPILTCAGGAMSGAAIAIWSHFSARRHSDFHAAPTLLQIEARSANLDAIRQILVACGAAAIRVERSAAEKEPVTEPASRREIA